MDIGNTNTIIIGTKNEEIFSAAFDVVRHLQKLPEPRFFAGEDGNGRYIKSGDGKLFRYDESYPGSARFEGGSDEVKDERIGFDYDGATWFKGLRDSRYRSAESDWEGLHDAVRKEYHKLYSILEYNPPPRNDARDRKTVESIAGYLAGIFDREDNRISVSKAEITDKSDKSGVTEIYGLSLRIALGAPEPDYVLCRLYFKETSDGIEPLDCERAEEISNIMTLQQKSVKGSKSEGNTQIDKGEDGQNIRSQALTALQELIEREVTSTEESVFSKCIYFPHEEDAKKVVNLRAKNAHSNADIECGSVEVLGISHIRWDSVKYDVSFDGEALLRIMIGLNDTICLQCLNCPDRQLLIENNRILCRMPEGDEKEIIIDPNEPNLGLTDEEVQTLKNSSPFGDHLRSLSKSGRCALDRAIQRFYNIDNPSSAATCGMRTRCKSQTLTLNLGKGKTEEVCLHCPYPEIVYVNPKTGSREATSTLDFFVDKLAMEASSDESGKRGYKCKVCNRSVSRSSKTCKCCSDALKLAKEGVLDGDKIKYAEALYHKYSKSLSLLTRLFSAFSKKYCFEDDGNILFVLGKKIYILNKLNISHKGYVPAAKRVKL